MDLYTKISKNVQAKKIRQRWLEAQYCISEHFLAVGIYQLENLT